MLGNAIEVMTQFLSGVPLNTAAGSSTASEGQRKSKEISSTASEDLRKIKEISYCVQCEVYCEGVEQYTVHIASRKHRKRVAGIARREGNKRRKEECDLSYIDTV